MLFYIKNGGSVLYTIIYFFVTLTKVYADKEMAHCNLISPYDAIVTHLGSLDPGNYHPDIAAAVFRRKGVSPAQAKRYAIAIKKLLDKEKIQINIETIPKEEDYIDPLVKYHKYQIDKKMPQIYLVRVEDKWLYSYETIYYLQKLDVWDHEKIEQWFPKWCKINSFLGFYLWQYILLVVCILILGGLYKLIILTICMLSTRWWLLEGFDKKLGKLCSTIVICFIAKLLLPMIQLSDRLEKNIIQGLEGLLSFLIMLQCYYLVNVFIMYIKKRAIAQNHSFTLHLLPLYHRLLKVIVVIVGSISTIDNLGYQTSSLLAGVSIGSLGFAFASQDTIKNLFGSLMILIDEPFRIGDYVTIGSSIEGYVEEIGFRSTRLRTQQGSMMCIPNAKLADMHIDNYSLRKKRRFIIEIMINCSTDSNVSFSFIEGLRSIAKNHVLISSENQFVYLNTIKNSSWCIFFSVDLNVKNKKVELKCRHEIISLIIRLAKTLDIQLGNVHGVSNVDIKK